MNSDGKYTRRRLNLEIPIVMLIAGLILVLMNFANKKLNELIISDTEVLFMDIDHDSTDQMHADFAERIADFRPDLYKMIEVYDGKLNEIVSINFAEDEYAKGNINDHPRLIELLTTNADGHASRDIDGSTEYIYFKWSYDDMGNPYLFIIYTYKPIVRHLWVFNVICYIVMLLICILLLRLSLKSHSEKIRLYNKLTSIDCDTYCQDTIR